MGLPSPTAPEDPGQPHHADPEPAPRPARERLRFTPRSLILAVAMLGATLAALRLVAASTRVIGWLLAAAAIASLLHPLVAGLSRWLPRGLAVVIVVVVTLGAVGVVTYSLVDTVVRETRKLQDAAPDAARKLERSARYGDLARDFKLVQRTEDFVDEVPARLRGGTPAEALRSAATRGVAFLATGVLSLFFLIHGPRLARNGVNQVTDPMRHARVERVASGAYQRMVRYASGTFLMALAAGLLGYLVAALADVRGAAALGLWVGLWDVVPLVGAFIGALPIILLALVFSWQRAVVVALIFVAYQVFESLVLQRKVERDSLHLGPFLTVAAGLIGIELYGLGGGLLALLLVCLAVGVADEVLPA